MLIGPGSIFIAEGENLIRGRKAKVKNANGQRKKMHRYKESN